MSMPIFSEGSNKVSPPAEEAQGSSGKSKSVQPESMKREQEDPEASALPEKKARTDDPESDSRNILQEHGAKKRFRILASMVRAMNRFKTSLNPTVDFSSKHKQTPETSEPKAVARWVRQEEVLHEKHDKRNAFQGTSFKHRGHKGAILVASLKDGSQD